MRSRLALPKTSGHSRSRDTTPPVARSTATARRGGHFLQPHTAWMVTPMVRASSAGPPAAWMACWRAGSFLYFCLAITAKLKHCGMDVK